MALCGGATVCNCAFHSSSLTFSGSGNPGDPVVVETYEGIVADDSEIASPFLGQRIYETTTGRLKVYDGTNWIIYGGNMPGWQIERQTAQTIGDTSVTAIIFPTEIYDTDAFHSGSDTTVTIPAGLSGDYLVEGYTAWTASATGYRSARLAVANNGGAPTQNNLSRVGGSQMINTANNGLSVTEILRLVAGATVGVNVVQNSGGDLTVTQVSLKGILLRHIPSLT